MCDNFSKLYDIYTRGLTRDSFVNIHLLLYALLTFETFARPFDMTLQITQWTLVGQFMNAISHWVLPPCQQVID